MSRSAIALSRLSRVTSLSEQRCQQRGQSRKLRSRGLAPSDSAVASPVYLTDIQETGYALDGAFGFEGRCPLESQVITASAGFEFRYGGKAAAEDQLQTNYTVFRAALALPLVGMTGLTLAVAAPIDGPISPALSVTFNWGLLLSKKNPLQ